MTLIVAVRATLALGSLDYLMIPVCFLYRPARAELRVAVMPTAALIAVVLRRRWLLLATQNALTGVVRGRVIEGGTPSGQNSVCLTVTASAPDPSLRFRTSAWGGLEGRFHLRRRRASAEQNHVTTVHAVGNCGGTSEMTRLMFSRLAMLCIDL